MVVITGATGLLGKHIVERFSASGVRLVSAQRDVHAGGFSSEMEVREADVLDQASLREAFEGADTVVHAAAFVSFNPRLHRRIHQINVVGTRHVVDTCLQLGIPNLVHISSVSALGRKPGELTTEESKWTGTHSTDYAESKYLAELEVFRGAEEGLTVSVVNPSVVLSGSLPGRSSASLLDYVWNENKFYTDGSLSYVDARDVAEAVYRLYAEPRAGERFILSAGVVSVHDFFSAVAAHFGKRAPSIRVSPLLSYWAGLAEEVRSAIFRSEPRVTRQSAAMAILSFRYDQTKARNILNMDFRKLEESLAWCCDAYLRNVKSNK